MHLAQRWPRKGHRGSVFSTVLSSMTIVGLAFLSGGCDKEHPSDPCAGGLPHYSAPTLIGALYDSYFSGNTDWEGSSVDALLYLDTGSLPSRLSHFPKLILSSLPTTPAAGADRIEFGFRRTLPDSVDPGLVDQLGWKVRLSSVTLRRCETCYTNCGLAPILLLLGDLDSIQCIYDPTDTLQVYIHRSAHGRLRTGGGSVGRPL